MGTKARLIEINPELRTRVREYLEKQGYEVTQGAKLVGKSGIEHAFDMLARRDDGLTSYTVAIGIATAGDRQTETATVFSLANKAYDCGILDRILVAVPELSEEAKQLAVKQRIKVIDGERIGPLSTVKPTPQMAKVEGPLSLETKEEMVKSLASRGYGVKERAKAKGRSGNEYVFDILAHSQDGQVEHMLGVDFLNGDKVKGP